MRKSVYSAIDSRIKSLPSDKIKEVRDFVEFLLSQTKKKVDFKELYGSINDEDADLMRKSIEEGCEKINYAQW